MSHLLYVYCVCEQGKRKRSRPSTATNTPVKDGSSDGSGAVKNSEETNSEEETSRPAVVDTCEPKPAEERNITDSSSTSVATPPAAVKEKSTKTSKDRSDRKRERRKERKSENGSPVMPPSERASPVCNGTAADDMNVCKCVDSHVLLSLVSKTLVISGPQR